MNPTTPQNDSQQTTPQNDPINNPVSGPMTPSVIGVETGQKTTPVEPQAYNGPATVPPQTNPSAEPVQQSNTQNAEPMTTEEPTNGQVSGEPSDQTNPNQPGVPTNTPVDFSMTDHSEVGVTSPVDDSVNPPTMAQDETAPQEPTPPATPLDPAEGAPNLNNDHSAVDEKIRQTAESPLNTGAPTEKKGNWFTRLFGGK